MLSCALCYSKPKHGIGGLQEKSREKESAFRLLGLYKCFVWPAADKRNLYYYFEQSIFLRNNSLDLHFVSKS